MTSPDFVVLTGFLGSGKTTLLRDFLAGPDAADTAVIVNEAGEIGLDGAILRESANAIPITMLANGCVCCQVGSDLALTIEALMAAARPGAAGPLRRIVLETSGLSKPGPVLRQLASLAGYRMRVSVLATYDGVRGAGVAEFEEAAAQWAAAHRIVLTKADVLSSERVAEASAEIRALNPLADIVAADRQTSVAQAFAPLAPTALLPNASCVAAEGRSHPRVAVRLARPTDILAYDDLAAWLDNMAGALGERLLRLKGLVRVAESDRPILVQSVGTLFSPPRPFGVPDDAASSFLVVIARDLRTGELEGVTPTNLFSVVPWRGFAPDRMRRTPRASGPIRAEVWASR